MRKLLKRIKDILLINIAVTSNCRYIEYLRKKGFKIGENCQFFARKSLYFDMTRPFLINIGNNVIITKGVTILTHGYDWAVLKHVYKKVIGSSRKVEIGNNIFIGVNSIIMPGTVINDNVIIGAGSVVSGVILANSVYAGNPAKLILTLDEYFTKRESNVLQEVVDLTKEYLEKYNSFPAQEIFYEHFDLFIPRNPQHFGNLNNAINSKISPYINDFLKTTPRFKDYEEFKNHIKQVINRNDSN